MKKKLTAIAIKTNEKGDVIGALKYRNILDTEAAKISFYDFLKRDHPDVSHVNWYEKSSYIGKRKVPGQFIEKIYIK